MAYQESNDSLSTSMFRLVGYGLILLALFDVINILLPFNFSTPWAFQTIGALVERVPVPLLGFALVFFGEANFRRKWEKSFLSALSWASLGIGLVFLLLVPTLLATTVRIASLTDAQVNTAASQQVTQLQTMEQQLGQADAQALSALMQRYNQQNGTEPDVNSPQEFKNRLQGEMTKTRDTIKVNAEAARSDRQLGTWKTALKWSVGSLVSGILFICIWRFTDWTRRKRRSGVRASINAG